MKNKKINMLEGYTEFSLECSFFRFEKEYPGWDGEEKWGIVTQLCENELLERFPSVMQALSPYMLLSPEYGKARKAYISNERKHIGFRERTESLYGFDGDTENHHPELVATDFTEELADRELMLEALACRTGLQRKRVMQYFLEGLTLKEIAESEGGNINLKTVCGSIKRTLRLMKEYMDCHTVE